MILYVPVIPTLQISIYIYLVNLHDMWYQNLLRYQDL